MYALKPSPSETNTPEPLDSMGISYDMYPSTVFDFTLLLYIELSLRLFKRIFASLPDLVETISRVS